VVDPVLFQRTDRSES